MGSGARTVDSDMFAAALEDIVSTTVLNVSDAAGKALTQSTRRGVKTVREKASGTGRKPWSSEYIGGFASHVSRGRVMEGEIGNKAKPGLVHLLEKGHQTINHGRKTAAFPHMKPALEEIEEDFARRMDASVDEALRR